MELPSVQFQIIAPIFQNGIALLGVSTLDFTCSLRAATNARH